MIAPWVVALIVSTVLQAAAYLLMPKQKTPGAQAGSLDVPRAEEGVEVPVVYGTVTLKSPIVIDSFRPSTVAIRSKGGKK